MLVSDAGRGARARAGLAVLLLAACLQARTSRAATGGPDGYGYTWADANSGCPVEADAFELASSASFFDGTMVRNVLGPLDLGFDFPYYGRITRQVWVNRSGLIFFEPPADAAYATNLRIPTPGAPAAFLAPFWDLLALDGPTSLWWESFPAQGFFKLSLRMRPVASSTSLQLEVYLYPNGDARIEYLSAWIPPIDTFTIGLEDPGSSTGLQLLHDGAAAPGFTYGVPMPFAVCIEGVPQLDCGTAADLDCGGVSAASPASVTRNVLEYACDPGGSWAGREAVFALAHDELVDLSVAVSGAGARRMTAFLVDGCDESECLAGGTSFDVPLLPPGDWALVVEAQSAADEGAFTLDVACTPLSAPLDCEEVVEDSTAGGPARLDAYPCLPIDFSGPERYYLLDFVPPGDINLTLEESEPGTGVFLFDVGAPLEPSRCLRGGIGGVVLHDPPAGRYVVVVDGPAAGAFRLTLHCQPEIRCSPGAGTLACNARITGTTVGRPSDVDFYGCNALQRHPGPEAVYQLDVPSRQIVSILLDDAADARLDLALLSACDEGECLESADRELTLDLPAGRYHVVVDSRGAAGAPFGLAVVCGAALTPERVTFTGNAGDCFEEDKTAWLTPEIVKADVLLALDLSGTMSQERDQLDDNMLDIITRLQAFIPDLAFGLVSHIDYPTRSSVAMTWPCPYSGVYGGVTEWPYRLHQAITTNHDAARLAVSRLPGAGFGGDAPEAQARLLHEVVNDPAVGWRPDSRRILVFFTDELPHGCNVLECLGRTAPSRGVDLGRDALPETGDEIQPQDAVQGLVDAGVILLLLDSSEGRGSLGADAFAAWDCWAQRTGGQAAALNRDGTVPTGIDLSQLIEDLVQLRGSACDVLELVASPGWEAWLASSTPVYARQRLPAVRDFDIRICIPPGTPRGGYDFEVWAVCSGNVVAVQQVHVDVGLCGVNATAPPPDVAVCEGGEVLLDASGLELVNCAAPASFEWREGATLIGTTAQVTVFPAASTTYEVTVSCPTEPTCRAVHDAVVDVQLPPLLDAAAAADIAPCNLGIELSWPPPVYRDPSRSGVVNVYRSEISCADALLRPPVAMGLTASRWVDDSTRAGGLYHYVVEAEDARFGTACDPQGPHNAGAVDRTCVPGPVEDVARPSFPDGVYTTLFLRHDRVAPGDRAGHQVTAHWTGARPLLAGEHFHLLKAWDAPTSAFMMVVPEAFLARSWTETDTRSWLQFFDLRVANACEEVSPDEYPPGF